MWPKGAAATPRGEPAKPDSKLDAYRGPRSSSKAGPSVRKGAASVKSRPAGPPDLAELNADTLYQPVPPPSYLGSPLSSIEVPRRRKGRFSTSSDIQPGGIPPLSPATGAHQATDSVFSFLIENAKPKHGQRASLQATLTGDRVPSVLSPQRLQALPEPLPITPPKYREGTPQGVSTKRRAHKTSTLPPSLPSYLQGAPLPGLSRTSDANVFQQFPRKDRDRERDVALPEKPTPPTTVQGGLGESPSRASLMRMALEPLTGLRAPAFPVEGGGALDVDKLMGANDWTKRGMRRQQLQPTPALAGGFETPTGPRGGPRSGSSSPVDCRGPSPVSPQTDLQRDTDEPKERSPHSPPTTTQHFMTHNHSPPPSLNFPPAWQSTQQPETPAVSNNPALTDAPPSPAPQFSKPSQPPAEAQLTPVPRPPLPAASSRSPRRPSLASSVWERRESLLRSSGAAAFGEVASGPRSLFSSRRHSDPPAAPSPRAAAPPPPFSSSPRPTDFKNQNGPSLSLSNKSAERDQELVGEGEQSTEWRRNSHSTDTKDIPVASLLISCLPPFTVRSQTEGQARAQRIQTARSPRPPPPDLNVSGQAVAQSAEEKEKEDSASPLSRSRQGRRATDPSPSLSIRAIQPQRQRRVSDSVAGPILTKWRSSQKPSQTPNAPEALAIGAAPVGTRSPPPPEERERRPSRAASPPLSLFQPPSSGPPRTPQNATRPKRQPNPMQTHVEEPDVAPAGSHSAMSPSPCPPSPSAASPETPPPIQRPNMHQQQEKQQEEEAPIDPSQAPIDDDPMPAAEVASVVDQQREIPQEKGQESRGNTSHSGKAALEEQRNDSSRATAEKKETTTGDQGHQVGVSVSLHRERHPEDPVMATEHQKEEEARAPAEAANDAAAGEDKDKNEKEDASGGIPLPSPSVPVSEEEGRRTAGPGEPEEFGDTPVTPLGRGQTEGVVEMKKDESSRVTVEEVKELQQPGREQTNEEEKQKDEARSIAILFKHSREIGGSDLSNNSDPEEDLSPAPSPSPTAPNGSGLLSRTMGAVSRASSNAVKRGERERGGTGGGALSCKRALEAAWRDDPLLRRCFEKNSEEGFKMKLSEWLKMIRDQILDSSGCAPFGGSAALSPRGSPGPSETVSASLPSSPLSSLSPGRGKSGSRGQSTNSAFSWTTRGSPSKKNSSGRAGSAGGGIPFSGSIRLQRAEEKQRRAEERRKRKEMKSATGCASLSSSGSDDQSDSRLGTRAESEPPTSSDVVLKGLRDELATLLQTRRQRLKEEQQLSRVEEEMGDKEKEEEKKGESLRRGSRTSESSSTKGGSGKWKRSAFSSLALGTQADGGEGPNLSLPLRSSLRWRSPKTKAELIEKSLARKMERDAAALYG
uniref:Uncharacterized protein n=1 Tax=Chromera velia CCMP2878 TaxID=1169474 RepID=A0A0G4HB34_9ALVE|eukprot:Cvel_25822.t1-p1 / transcript=Cvel_25822.t1 / gene=Cvel_25822 / organism=Chromera_velia_CCMP2878 / gene_product=hypothetical protein / transcript_product=hypothetical protein / location=Cvel_scaffold2978:9383-15230(-) / protein_length=1372 / sequence_SO=supercontig / SO=protein_coding / is_pseudo=false